jgi:UDP-N-acetylglucosamine 4-epimerase
MNKIFEKIQHELTENPRTWLITGVAGFIGSHLLETLLGLNQRVVGIDNFSTGHDKNLIEIKSIVSSEQWKNFHMITGDICNLDDCKNIFKPFFDGVNHFNIDYVLHQAALGSVPRSLEDPIKTNQNNINGFLNMLVAANDAKIKKFVYAASSSTYGDHPSLPKKENNIGQPLSPYAVTKLVNELYAQVFTKQYGLDTIGLRYFNVFGPRQDPNGAYAAVIPKWILSLLKGEAAAINGNGENSRDFCFVDNAVQANIIASLTVSDNAGQIYNVAVGERTSLNMLYDLIVQKLLERAPESIKIQSKIKPPLYRMARKGDVIHSQADISKIKNALGYFPKFDIKKGLDVTVDWYIDKIFHSD